MFEELNEQLIDVKEKLRVRQRLQNDLSKIQESLTEQKSKLMGLEFILQEETADVSRLEGLSLAAIFYTVLGNKEKQFEKERQEYLAAKLRYDECKSAVSTLETEALNLKGKIAELVDLEVRYASLMDRKEKLIVAGNNPVTKEYTHLSEQLADVRPRVREIEQAINAGKAVIDGLKHTIEALNSARNWGTWDMLGGGLIVTAMKHSRIDDARSSIHYVQQMLRKFQREIADVSIDSQAGVDIKMEKFERFADHFFDNLIVDWIVQAKIENSLNSVINIEVEVQNVMARLQTSLREMQRRVSHIEEQRRMLIEAA